MKKLLILMGLVGFSALSMSANAVTIVEKQMGYVVVNSTAEKEMLPDTASIYLSVETVSVDSKEAVSKNKEISTKIIDSIKPILALEKADSIQTKNFVLRPNYTYEKNGKKNFVNFTAVNSILVKTKKLENVSKIIDTAVANNATTVSDLNFYIENEKQCAGELIQEAIRKAKVQAKLSASTLDQRLVGVKSMRVNVYPQNNYYPRYEMMNASAKGVNTAAKQTPVEYGKIKLQANVDAEFYVK